jgi:hypothetical protein
MRNYLTDYQKGEFYDLADSSLIANFIAIPCQNLAHCVFIMKYWIVSKKIESSLLRNKEVDAGFEGRIHSAMACLFFLYSIACAVGLYYSLKDVGPPANSYIAWTLDIPALVGIPFLGSAFWRLCKCSGSLQFVSKKQIWL